MNSVSLDQSRKPRPREDGGTQQKQQGGCADRSCRFEVIYSWRRPRSRMQMMIVLVMLLLTCMCFNPSLAQVGSLVQVLPNEDDPICLGSIIIYNCTVTDNLLRWSYTNGGDPVEVPFHDSDAVSTVKYLGPFKVVLVGNDFINGSSVLTSTASIGNGVMADVNNKSISCESPQFSDSKKISFAEPKIMNASFCMCTIYWEPPPCDANCTVRVDEQDVGVVPCSDGNLSVESDLSTKTVNITARDQLGMSVVVQAVPAVGTGMPCNVLCLETSGVSPSVTSSTMPHPSTNLALIIGLALALLLLLIIAVTIMVVVFSVRKGRFCEKLIVDQEKKSYKLDTFPIIHCKIAPGAACVAIADSSGCVRVLKCDSGDIVKEYMSDSSVISLGWLEYEGKNCLMFANQTHMKLINVREGRVLDDFELQGFCQGSRVICLAHCVTRFVFALSCLLPTNENDGDHNGLIIIDDHGEGRDNMMCPVPVASPVSCLVFNYRGTQIITGDIGGKITVFNVQIEGGTYKATALCDLPTHRGIVYNLQYSFDEEYVYSIGKDDEFLLKNKLSIANFTKTSSKKIKAGAVSNVQAADETFCVCGQFFCLMPRKQYILTSSNAQGIVYKISTWRNAAVKLALPPFDANVTCVDWKSSRDVKFTCVFGCADNSVHVMDIIIK